MAMTLAPGVPAALDDLSMPMLGHAKYPFGVLRSDPDSIIPHRAQPFFRV
jgi:hypothetical protein